MIALAVGILAAAATIGVPALAFRFALNQEKQRFAREQRAQLYIDLLAIAHTRKKWYEVAAGGTRRTLPPVADRITLEARMSALASFPVMLAFLRFEDHTKDPPSGTSTADEQTALEYTRAHFFELRRLIRNELGVSPGQVVFEDDLPVGLGGRVRALLTRLRFHSRQVD